MSLGANTLHPLQIEDARNAAYEASKRQKDVEQAITDASKKFAEAERQYRLKLTERILHLHAQDQVAWTACGEIARGEKEVADLRYARDVAKGVLDAAEQQAFRRGADRKDVHQFLVWSERRDFHMDSPPPNVNPRTGEVTGPRAVA